VLADIQAQGGVDGYWLLGDYCALGPDPVEVLERITKLPNAQFIRGNTDRYITTNNAPEPSLAAVTANPSLLAKHTEVQRSMAWTQGAITVTGWLDWVAQLPLDIRLTLPDGTRVLLVHAAPGADDGQGIYPTHTDEELRTLLGQPEADVICVGHNHCVIDRTLENWRVLNPGSLSNPLASDVRASYMIINADEAGYRVQAYRVDYDHMAAIEQVRKVQHPGAGYIIRLLSGQIKRAWET
jgi:putative phosphoesterase